jgi:hypothetical protein
MHLTDLFDRAYVINLPARADRRKSVARELRRAGMPLSPGRVEVFPAIRPDSAGRFPSIGARGCFLSHLMVLKKARDQLSGNLLVLEDDLSLNPAFGDLEPEIAHQLAEADWDIVYFGHRSGMNAQEGPVLVPCDGPVLLAHFVGYHRRVLGRLIEFLELLIARPAGHPDGGPMHFDGALSTFRSQNPDVVTLLTWPMLGWQGSSRSDICDGNWFDRVPVLRELAGCARGVKRWLGPRSRS